MPHHGRLAPAALIALCAAIAACVPTMPSLRDPERRVDAAGLEAEAQLMQREAIERAEASRRAIEADLGRARATYRAEAARVRLTSEAELTRLTEVYSAEEAEATAQIALLDQSARTSAQAIEDRYRASARELERRASLTESLFGLAQLGLTASGIGAMPVAGPLVGGLLAAAGGWYGVSGRRRASDKAWDEAAASEKAAAEERRKAVDAAWDESQARLLAILTPAPPLRGLSAENESA